jgi:hypothetical protein
MKLGKLILAAALAACGGIHAALADTIGYADAYDRIAVACGADVQKFCSGVQLGDNGVRDCLTKNQARVSGRCKAVVADTFALLQARAQAQASARRVCDPDVREFCSGVVPHDGHQLTCLLQSNRVTSAACRQVLTDAGWN